MADFQTLGDAVQGLLAQQRALLDVTKEEGARKQINQRIELLDEKLDDLIDASWDQYKASNQYQDAIKALNAAHDAVTAAEAELKAVDQALQRVDQALEAIAQLVKLV